LVSAQNPIITITATNAEGDFSTYIKHSPNGQATVGNYDMSFFTGGANESAQIYTLKPDENSNLQKLALNTINTDEIIIPLGVSITSNSDIVFAFEGMDAYNCNITFKDNFTDEEMNLSGLSNFEYPVNVTGSTDTRFTLQFSQPVPTSTEQSEISNVQAFVSGGQINVRANAGNIIQSIKVFGVSGLLVANEIVNCTNFVLEQTLPAGVYLVRVQTAKETKTQKIVLK
ncbi:MAG: T9SS type A sorting domain-containing protein, partial [Prevotellaceae bacterium]|nr:T9SS type A sorting domain-containing protein [Prevotellaceae bacterium]